MPRIVFHLDMDAFFASVEERDHPEFANMPIVVGSDPKEGKGRGVVSTANYEARKYGIGSALPISKAWSLCEEGVRRGGKKCIFFGGNHGKYGKESQRIMNIIQKSVAVLEQAGLDEAYFEADVSDYDSAERLARKIKKDIKKETKLTASIGIGPNKLVAKVASDAQKPDGLTVVLEDDVQDFLDPYPPNRIQGIGPKAATLLALRGAKTIKEARRFSPSELRSWFGKSGEAIHKRLRGVDERPLALPREKKSMGHEVTFMEDVRDPAVLTQTLNKLSEKVASEVLESGLYARRLTIRIRFDDFTTLTRQTTLKKPSDDAVIFRKESLKLFMPFLDSRENQKNKAFRLLGVRAGSLTAERSLDI